MEKLRQGATYNTRLFRRDLTAGLTVAAVAVPQAMAYALIAGIPPQYGLYTAIVLTTLASLFNSSAHLINGPTNAISLVVFSAVAGLPDVNGGEHLQAVFLLAMLVGLIQLLIALLRLGDLTRYISESVILGFMAGAGILVGLEQIPNLLGLEQAENGAAQPLIRLWQTVQSGSPNFHSLGIGIACVLTIGALRWLGRRLRLNIPDLLLTLILASLAVWLLGWNQPRTGVRMVLAVSGELPLPHWPTVQASWLRPLSSSALPIALLGLLESLAIAKSIAARTRQPIDFNRQCLAEGLANLGGGLFQCMPGSGSLTRSAVNYQAGAATRVSGIIAAGAVASVLLVFAPLAHYVPKAALAGILFVIAWRLVDRHRLFYALRATRFDMILASATALVAIFISIEFAILIGTFLSFLFFVPRAARLQAHELVVSPERVVRERQPQDPQCTRMALVSLEGELFFGAGPELDEHLAELQRRVADGVRVIVLRLKRARNPDMVCLERLQRFIHDMQMQKVAVLLCGVRAEMATTLANVGVDRLLPRDRLFLEDGTTGSSTLAAVRYAYELLGAERCVTCPRRQETSEMRSDWYYMI